MEEAVPKPSIYFLQYLEELEEEKRAKEAAAAALKKQKEEEMAAALVADLQECVMSESNDSVDEVVNENAEEMKGKWMKVAKNIFQSGNASACTSGRAKN